MGPLDTDTTRYAQAHKGHATTINDTAVSSVVVLCPCSHFVTFYRNVYLCGQFVSLWLFCVSF